jgi:hypothetical protein
MIFQRYDDAGTGTIQVAVIQAGDGRRVDIPADLLLDATAGDELTGAALQAAQEEYNEVYSVPPTAARRHLRKGLTPRH